MALEKVILNLKNCLTELHNYLVCMIVMIVIFSYFPDGGPGYAVMIFTVSVPLYFYFLRVKVHRFWLFALLHLIPFGMIVVIFTKNLGQMMVFLITALIFLCFSMGIRIAVYTRPDRRDYGSIMVPPPLVIALGTASFLLESVSVIIVLVIYIIVLHFACLYLTNFLHYIDMSRRTTGSVPTREILTVDFTLVGGFTLLAVLLMAAFAGRDIFINFGSWIIELLLKLLALLNYLVGKGITESEAPQSAEAGEITLIETYVKEPGAFALFLEQVLAAFTAIFITVAGIALVCTVIVLIYRAFKLRAPENEISHGGDEDVVEILERPKWDKKPKFKINLFLTADEKIRRIFVAVIEKNKNFTPNDRNGTARELLFQYMKNHNDSEAAGVLVDLYEKARYAQASCTAADVRMAKKMASIITR